MGEEYKTYVDDSLYASTPPLEGLRLIMSRAATDDKPRVLMVNDVRRAYIYAKATRELYVELPAEDAEHGCCDKVGRLRLCLYGTRDAALNWQETLSDHLVNIGNTLGVGFPSVCVHREKGLWTLVHGDDYISAGDPESLDWLEVQLKSQYDIRTQRIGMDLIATWRGIYLTELYVRPTRALNLRETLVTLVWR